MALPSEQMNRGTPAKFKLNSQGMWTGKTQHLRSSPLAPHLCMTSVTGRFSVLLLSPDGAHAYHEIKPTSDQTLPNQRKRNDLLAYHGPPPTYFLLLENMYFPRDSGSL